MSGAGTRAQPAPGRGRVAALDLGSRRIGVAYSDSARSLASPWGTIERSGDPARDRAAVVDAVREMDAVAVVVGLPLSLSGRVGPAAQAALAGGRRPAAGARTARGGGGDGGRAAHDGRGAALVAPGGTDRALGPTGDRQRRGHGAAPGVAGPIGPDVTQLGDGDGRRRRPRGATTGRRAGGPGRRAGRRDRRAVARAAPGRPLGPRPPPAPHRRLDRRGRPRGGGAVHPVVRDRVPCPRLVRPAGRGHGRPGRVDRRRGLRPPPARRHRQHASLSRSAISSTARRRCCRGATPCTRTRPSARCAPSWRRGRTCTRSTSARGSR